MCVIVVPRFVMTVHHLCLVLFVEAALAPDAPRPPVLAVEASGDLIMGNRSVWGFDDAKQTKL